ncbi:hypothetical protein [Mycobacterium uberis]|uniref:hypothetical protein n=1 Tax=Mycobacterium uberis TaxID=2162698 RepID=UPI001FB3DD4D|nr:hypothetical protein [Mycobacterium uberis]
MNAIVFYTSAIDVRATITAGVEPLYLVLETFLAVASWYRLRIATLSHLEQQEEHPKPKLFGAARV